MAKSHVLACWDLCSKSHWADIKVSALMHFPLRLSILFQSYWLLADFSFLQLED